MISVIIPVFNECQNIRNCIEGVLSEGTGSEIIVCDGGSTDGSPDAVETFLDSCVTLLRTRKGRGTQMNAGASAAGGDILLFLHADTRLDRGWHDAVLRALDDPAVAAGAFSLRIGNPKWRYRLIEYMVKYRCRILKLPYGDQALFMKRNVFERIGGYRDIPLMEDVEIADRLKGAGTIVILDKVAVTDARRWEKEGWLYTSARNQLIRCLYRIGVDPGKLAGIYYR
jgi:rSAM/selenodomain-associated transferase 2